MLFHLSIACINLKKCEIIVRSKNLYSTARKSSLLQSQKSPAIRRKKIRKNSIPRGILQDFDSLCRSILRNYLTSRFPDLIALTWQTELTQVKAVSSDDVRSEEGKCHLIKFRVLGYVQL